MSAWCETGRTVAEFWSLTVSEISLVLASHAEARRRDVELAYYTAWHSGLFSQPFKAGKFPEYQKHAPGKKAANRPLDVEASKASARAFTLAMGGVVNERPH